MGRGANHETALIIDAEPHEINGYSDKSDRPSFFRPLIWFGTTQTGSERLDVTAWCSITSRHQRSVHAYYLDLLTDMAHHFQEAAADLDEYISSVRIVSQKASGEHLMGQFPSRTLPLSLQCAAASFVNWLHECVGARLDSEIVLPDGRWLVPSRSWKTEKQWGTTVRILSLATLIDKPAENYRDYDRPIDLGPVVFAEIRGLGASSSEATFWFRPGMNPPFGAIVLRRLLLQVAHSFPYCATLIADYEHSELDFELGDAANSTFCESGNNDDRRVPVLPVDGEEDPLQHPETSPPSTASRKNRPGPTRMSRGQFWVALNKALTTLKQRRTKVNRRSVSDEMGFSRDTLRSYLKEFDVSWQEAQFGPDPDSDLKR
jgi:hypothetical protein